MLGPLKGRFARSLATCMSMLRQVPHTFRAHMAIVPLDRVVQTPGGNKRMYEAKYDDEYDSFKDMLASLGCKPFILGNIHGRDPARTKKT